MKTKQTEHGWVRRFGVASVIVGMLLAVVGLTATPASANHNGQKYTICHRTNSNGNPYVQITVDEAAVDGAAPGKGDHFLEHVGPVWDGTQKAAQDRVGRHHPADPRSPRRPQLDRRRPGHLQQRLQSRGARPHW